MPAKKTYIATVLRAIQNVHLHFEFFISLPVMSAQAKARAFGIYLEPIRNSIFLYSVPSKQHTMEPE